MIEPPRMPQAVARQTEMPLLDAVAPFLGRFNLKMGKYPRKQAKTL
nr:MAG TPA: hypothetical protein [Caudoviricetes sp.]